MPAILFTNGDVTTQSVGQIVRQVGSTVVLALADTASNVAKLVGVRLSTVTAGNSGFIAGYVPGMKIQVEAEPTVGNELWLSSSNAGVAALSAGTVPVLLGVCVAKNQDGGVWYADVIPEILNPQATPINEQTGVSYTVQISDADGIVSLDNASPITVTLPADIVAKVPVGTTTMFWQKGDGKVTFVADAGATLLVPVAGALSIPPLKNSVATWAKVEVDTWLVCSQLVG